MSDTVPKVLVLDSEWDTVGHAGNMRLICGFKFCFVRARFKQGRELVSIDSELVANGGPVLVVVSVSDWSDDLLSLGVLEELRLKFPKVPIVAVGEELPEWLEAGNQPGISGFLARVFSSRNNRRYRKLYVKGLFTWKELSTLSGRGRVHELLQDLFPQLFA